MIPMCIDMGVGVIPWSPLARGFLAGNRSREDFGETTRAKTDNIAQGLYYVEADFRVVDALKAEAEKLGIKPAQLALAWMLNKPGITAPIIGASKMYQLDEALAVADLKLDPSVIEAVEAPYQPKGVLGHD
jgi:aryl-alcohol dehydrogenase (NADP+)